MKKRIDDILVELNHFENKSKAKSNLIQGNVMIDNEKITKSGSMFDIDKIKDKIQIINQNTNKFVSRAGDKLNKAITKYNINLNNKVCMDIGSSTGGFTDCCLQNNAKLVYAIDVGTNQLEYKLRIDNRVIVLEKTNFRYLEKNILKEKVDFVCCDVSFISLNLIFENLVNIVEEGVKCVFLIKPQFESTKENIKKGKLSDLKEHVNVIKKVITYCDKYNIIVDELDYSPILGNKKKNVEYLIVCHIDKNSVNKIEENKIKEIVYNADLFFKENNYETI